MSILVSVSHPTQHRILMQKDVRNISYISLQLKYCRNIFVKYCKIFNRKIFWNISEIFDTFGNIVEIFHWNVPILHTWIIFPNVANDDEKLFIPTLYFWNIILEILFNSVKLQRYFLHWNWRILPIFMINYLKICTTVILH